MSDAVFEALSDSIRSLELPPGTPVTEPAVAAALHVSRSPVREAFTRLADLGLIVVVPQVGSRIAPISLRDVEEAVFIRRSLESSAFRQAIRADTLDTAGLQSHIDANAAAARAGDLDAFFTTDELIHQEVFALAGLPRLWGLVQGSKLQLDRLRRLNLSAAIVNPEVISEHQQIVDAFVARDEDAGVRVIDAHATRILSDTVRLREANPSYFTSY